VHHSHVEGGRIFLGPFWLPQRTASYRELRARRLAACGAPDELRDWWRGLETSPAPPLPPLPQPGAGLVAALLAADILAWLDGCPPPSEGHEVEVDVAEGRWWWHPVLPLPKVGLLDDE
jgi:bacteriocin biosynthesis cyclodehydratase domain-containing protein